MVGSRSAPVGTPSDFRSTNKVREIAESIKGPRFGAYSHPSQTFRIRSLKVGNKVLENVNGSVASAEGSLLLGQSFLGRLNSWSVDDTKHVLVFE